MNRQTITNFPPRVLRAALLGGGEFLHRAGIESARLDAEVLLCHALALNRTELFLRLEQGLSLDKESLFQGLLERRARHEPVAYITGVKEFWSLAFTVDRNVLVPRPETELLVEWALTRARKITRGSALTILDVGTGSGAVAIALATELPDARFWAVDISPGALAVARVNAQRHGVEPRMRFLAGNMFEPLAEQSIQFDLIVSNPPYVPRPELADLPAEIREYEPVAALDGGHDGLGCYRRMLASAPHFLAPGGFLLCEIGADQGRAVKELIARSGGLESPAIYQDLAGKDRVVAVVKGGACG